VKDTGPDIEATFAALLGERSGSDRVRMMSEMFDMARVLMTANIRADHPDISHGELRVRLFERTYAQDFNPDELARIVERLRAK
jgi:hypothetical protein